MIDRTMTKMWMLLFPRRASLCLLLLCWSPALLQIGVKAWIIPSQRVMPVGKAVHRHHPPTLSKIRTTSIPSSFYSMDEGEENLGGVYNPYEPQPSDRSEETPLKAPPGTRLVLGLNKYTHDTSLCAANARTGEVLFALSKERLTRKKHDAGNTADLVDVCLQQLDLDLKDIETVVVNNHHHRVFPLEESRRQMEFEAGLNINGGAEPGYEDDENVLPNVENKMEISHHLAHAYSAAAQSPFDEGMVVVMDGMGETYRTMLRARIMNDEDYISDFSLTDSPDDIEMVPSDIFDQSQISYFDWREAESVYLFTKNQRQKKLDIQPIFKRFTPENTPPTLYNHGFENMDSVGAIYSRASSDIFGDWNACGKVMGLAPWQVHSWDMGRKKIAPLKGTTPIMSGTIYSEKPGYEFRADRNLIAGNPLIARSDPELFDERGNFDNRRRYDFDDNEGVPNTPKMLPTRVALDAITLAARIQIDLENIVMDFVKHFQMETNSKNLCLAGGVALNSVLNGRLSRELGFDSTFVPPYPGDDGIAVGCCAFGLFGRPGLTEKTSPLLWKEPLSPYLGPLPTDNDIKRAIRKAQPWLDVETVRSDERRIEIMAQEVQAGGVVAWYHGRSEMGPRALGHRSILADPRKKGLVRFINQHVKKRETFRPFAPSVLVEEADEWFDVGPSPDNMDHPNNVSPYMSQTAFVREDKIPLIPAVTHVDGSSRLQTVSREEEPLYHRFLAEFFKNTGVPLVLNTSFNTLKGEPIVESPENAIRSFLSSMGSIEMLVLGDYIIKRKQPNLRKLLGETSEDGQAITAEPARPKRSGPAFFKSSFELLGEITEDENMEPVTKVRIPTRPMHCERTNNWFELSDELEGEVLSVCDGTVELNEILAQYTAVPDDKEMTDEEVSDSQILAESVIERLVRLYEHTLIYW